jgi:hypothetical protein
VLTRVRQRFRTFTGVIARRTCQFAWLPAIGKLSGDTMMVGVILIAVLVAVLVVGVLLPAVWSVKPARRRAALAVMDRLLPWKGR